MVTPLEESSEDGLRKGRFHIATSLNVAERLLKNSTDNLKVKKPFLKRHLRWAPRNEKVFGKRQNTAGKKKVADGYPWEAPFTKKELFAISSKKHRIAFDRLKKALDKLFWRQGIQEELVKKFVEKCLKEVPEWVIDL